MLLDVAVLALFYYSFFGILFVQLFAGQLRYRWYVAGGSSFQCSAD
jgi:hypothetical protein